MLPPPYKADDPQIMSQLLASTPYAGWPSTLAAADASHRAYWRLSKGGVTRILMLAPPGLEDVRPFLHVASLLRSMGLHAPKVYYEDIQQGILVLEDLGTVTFRHQADMYPDQLPRLYQLLQDVVVHIYRACHDASTPEIHLSLQELSSYDEPTFWQELMVFFEWYLGRALGVTFSHHAREELRACHQMLIARALQVPSTLVLRDALVDNFMYCPSPQGTCSSLDPCLAQCGILDFQDALWGPVTYDFASLYHDARYDVPLPMIAEHMAALEDQLGPLEDSFYILAALRNLKILGVFTRLAMRDKKTRYKEHFPRIYRWLALELQHPALDPLRGWFARHCDGLGLPFLTGSLTGSETFPQPAIVPGLEEESA